jgi:hypothetical protein
VQKPLARLAAPSSGTDVEPSSPLTAEDKFICTSVNTHVQITLTGSGSVKKFFLVSIPKYGRVTPLPDSPHILTYVPNKGFTGIDDFTYKCSDGHGTDSNIAKVTITVDAKVPRSAHILWIIVAISLVVAIYAAYLETTSESTLDWFLPKTNVTVLQTFTSSINTTTITTTSPTSDILSVPQIPRFVLLWGYIGAALFYLDRFTLLFDTYFRYHR